jgi:hypothetical protein
LTWGAPTASGIILRTFQSPLLGHYRHITHLAAVLSIVSAAYPDLALVRHCWKRAFQYQTEDMQLPGYRLAGHPEQRRRLNKAIGIMAILIILWPYLCIPWWPLYSL